VTTNLVHCPQPNPVTITVCLEYSRLLTFPQLPPSIPTCHQRDALESMSLHVPPLLRPSSDFHLTQKESRLHTPPQDPTGTPASHLPHSGPATPAACLVLQLSSPPLRAFAGAAPCEGLFPGIPVHFSLPSPPVFPRPHLIRVRNATLPLPRVPASSWLSFSTAHLTYRAICI
jgi:hypothetical protein